MLLFVFLVLNFDTTLKLSGQSLLLISPDVFSIMLSIILDTRSITFGDFTRWDVCRQCIGSITFGDFTSCVLYN